MHSWYVAVNGQQHGPFDQQHIQQALKADQYNPDTLVWREGFGDWIAIARVPELQESSISMAPPPYGEILRSVEERLEAFRPGPLGAQGLAPHAPHTVARPLMAALRERFHDPRSSSANGGEGLPFAVHMAEPAEERLRTRALARAKSGL